MRLSNECIKSLQALLRELGLNYTNEQTQEAGLTIMRFMIAKQQRISQISNNNGDDKNE